MHGLQNGEKEVIQLDDMAYVIPYDPDGTFAVPMGK